MCPHSAVRLPGGSQLHLGDSAAGLHEDALPGKSVRPVQPQLLAQNKFTSRCRCPAPDRRADPDQAQLVPCINQDGRGGSDEDDGFQFSQGRSS